MNGVDIPLRALDIDGAVLLQARIPAQVLALRPDRVRIGLGTKHPARPCDLNPSSPDKRSLGLGIRRITLTPAPPD